MKKLLASSVIALFLVPVCILGGYIPPGPLYKCPKEMLLLHPCECTAETDQGLHINCSNTNLAVMSVALNNLATFKMPIEKLTLYKCHIARLFGSLLYKLQLRTLYIEQTPIETIDPHTFLGVNNTLNELHLINSSLKEFPTAAFKILGNLTVLNIDGHDLNVLPKDAFVDSDMTGRLLKLFVPNGNLSQIPVESLQTLRRLKTLDFHGNKINELKKGQFKGMRELEFVDLSHNQIKKVDASHLADLTKLGFFNVSHNNLDEITRGAFARNTVLKLLNMSSNKIRKLDPNTFRGMRFLRRLYLSDNLINDVGRGTFSALAKVGTIDLARNLLKKVDYQMFFELKFIDTIDLSENNITAIQKLAFKDIYLTHINLARNRITTIEAGSFKNCANITKLDLSHNLLENINKKAFDDTTYATELQLSYNFLTSMSQVPLQNMTGLKVLNVSHNSIENIPKGTFPKLYELHTIDLSYNNLTDIFNAVFQTLFSLRSLDLSHNDLATIKHSTFGPLPTLLELDLSYNQLNDVSRSALTRLASTRKLTMRGNYLKTLFQLPISVSHLDLSDNEFEEIPPKLWPSMNSLLELDLSYNKIGNGLGQGSFENLLTLQKLNLNYNGIENPPLHALSQLSSLQYLYLEGNKIVKLKKGAFGKLPVVFELNLADNDISEIDSRAFDGLLQLLVLNLTNNNISHISGGAFQGLVALQTLDLSHNHIEKLDNRTHGLFEDCLSLEKLNLSVNRISQITRKTFPSNPYIPYKLRQIDLSYNSLSLVTFDLTFGTSKVEKLNLSHNSIADLRKGVLANLTSLVSLDLSYNKLEDLNSNPQVFRLPADTLSELYLSHNTLQDLPWGQLRNVTHLTKLDIRHNFFEKFPLQLTQLVLNQTDVYFEGNPLTCDCFVRPLKHRLASQLTVEDWYKSITCSNPPYLSGRKLFEVPDDRLNCPLNVNTSRIMENEPGIYDLPPDLKYRELTKLKNRRIKVQWRVLSNEDIADVYLVVRNPKNPDSVAYKVTVPYFQRSFEINPDSSQLNNKNSSSAYQICLLARDSKTFIRSFHKEQCKELPQTSGTHRTTQPFLSSVLIVITCFFVIVSRSQSIV